MVFLRIVVTAKLSKYNVKNDNLRFQHKYKVVCENWTTFDYNSVQHEAHYLENVTEIMTIIC